MAPPRMRMHRAAEGSWGATAALALAVLQWMERMWRQRQRCVLVVLVKGTMALMRILPTRSLAARAVRRGLWCAKMGE